MFCQVVVDIFDSLRWDLEGYSYILAVTANPIEMESDDDRIDDISIYKKIDYLSAS